MKGCMPPGYKPAVISIKKREKLHQLKVHGWHENPPNQKRARLMPSSGERVASFLACRIGVCAASRTHLLTPFTAAFPSEIHLYPSSKVPALTVATGMPVVF